MSIAVSVVVKPSRFLLAAVGALCIAIAFFAGMIGMGQIGKLSIPMRLIIAGSCSAAAFFAFYWTARTRKTFRIDISDIGQIRLMEYIGSGEFPFRADGAKSNIVSLMPDSTIWPHMLLLRLRGEDDQINIVPILRDCMDENAFQSLSVACRWVAAQGLVAEKRRV